MVGGRKCIKKVFKKIKKIKRIKKIKKIKKTIWPKLLPRPSNPCALVTAQMLQQHRRYPMCFTEIAALAHRGSCQAPGSPSRILDRDINIMARRRKFHNK